MYKACIFDLDGTLTDTLDSLLYSVNAMLDEMNLPHIDREQCKSFVGNGARHLVRKTLCAVGDVNLERMDEAMEVYARCLQKYCTYNVAPYAGICEMVQALKTEGVQLCVLSNKPHLQAQDVISTFFEEGTFTVVYGQRDDVPRKPDPAAVYMILEELGVKKEETLYIGDSDVDMMTGRAAEVTTIGVTWGFRDKDVLIEHGSTYTVDRPEEIVSIVKGAR